MARAKTNKLYRTFVKGLITEAGYLTYPEDASTDELNTILSRKGNRTRRLGIDFEDDFQLVDVDFQDGDAIQEFVWSNANNDPNQNFVVIQVGYKVHFFEINNEAISTNKTSFTISLLDYKVAGVTADTIRSVPVAFAAGAGFLFIAHPNVDPLNAEYVPETKTLVVTGMVVVIRDLDGVDDGLANDQEPTTLSVLHHYNLLNQGWGPPGTTNQVSYYYNPNTGTPPVGNTSTGTTSPPATGGGGYVSTPDDGTPFHNRFEL